MNPFVRSPYNYDMNVAGDESGLDCSRTVDPETGEVVLTPSLAKQSFAEEVDINTIVRRFGLTGQLPQAVRPPTFGDFENIPDYHAAMNAIRLADEAFMEMPAEVRARFGNDAGSFVEFVSDENNRDEARKLGLLVPEAPAEAGVVPAPALPLAPAPAPAPGAAAGVGAPLVT